MSNKNNSILYISAAALGLALLAPSAAQTPPGLMNFQGRLTDASNNPLSGPHDFIFEVYDAPSGGAQLWTEAQAGIVVANGVLAAQLGEVTPITAAVFAAPDAYLQITVDLVPLSPRQRLVTAPYAFNASSLQGRDYAAFVSTDAASQTIAGDKTFIGKLTVPRLVLSGGVVISSETLPSLGAGVRVSSNVYIVGFSSAVKYYGDGSALTGISGAGIDNLGNHIATTTLNMSGHSILNVASATFSNSVTVYSTVTVLASEAAAASLWVSTSNVTPHFYVSTGGNVGIGTASPGAKLQVADSGASGGYIMVINSGSEMAAWFKNK